MIAFRKWLYPLAYKISLVTLVLPFIAASASPALAQAYPPDPLVDPTFDQNHGAQVPLELEFRDEAGRTVRLADFTGEKPLVLALAYYECPMLCSIVLTELTQTMRALPFDIGGPFEVVTVSIDPGETPELAAAKKAAFLDSYGRAGGEEGWHFLTGEQEAIDRLADAIGFRYVYDAEIDQYAHPAGITILTPQNRVSRYLFGIDYSPAELRLAIVEASEEQIATPVDRFILLCYGYDPETGRYTLLIHNILRLAGLFTVLALGGFLAVLIRHERARYPIGEKND